MKNKTLNKETNRESVKTRILVFFPGPFSKGGIEKYLLSFNENINKDLFAFDYICERCEGIYREKINSFGGKIFSLPKERSVLSYKAYFLHFLELGYRIIHFHSDDFALLAMIGAKLAGFPVIIGHSHNNGSFCGNPFVSAFKRRIISSLCDYRLAVSESAGKWLFGHKPFELMEACIEPDEYIFSLENRRSIRRKFDIDDGTVVIGNVGHLLEAHKNQSFLFKVLGYIQENVCKAALMLVGGGFDEELVRKKASESGVKNIIFAGSVDSVPFYSAFDVFSMPSYHEGISLACIEAIINGLVCVNSINVPSAERLERYEKSLSLDEDVSAWSQSIIQAARNRKTACPKEFFSSPYNPKHAVHKLESFYRDIISKI